MVKFFYPAPTEGYTPQPGDVTVDGILYRLRQGETTPPVKGDAERGIVRVLSVGNDRPHSYKLAKMLNQSIEAID